MLTVVGDMDIEGLDYPGKPFPAEVEFIISAMDAGPKPADERRELKRTSYRVRALVQLFSDSPDAPPTVLYIRSVSPQAIGFLTERHLPLSHGGIIHLPGPDGKPKEIYCTILRCRQVASGWYEGAAYFNRQQCCFAADAMTGGESQPDEPQVMEDGEPA